MRVQVQPGASSDQVSFDGEQLRVRVATAAIEGRANRRLIEVLAKHLGVAPSRLRIVRGQRSRQKLVDLGDITLDDLRARSGD